MLFARLQLTLPEARAVLVAPPRSSLDVSGLASDLAECAATSGFATTLVDVRGLEGLVCPVGALYSQSSDQAEAADAAAGSLHKISIGGPSGLNIEQLRRALGSSEGFSVLLGAGLLDNPATLLAVPLVDAVIVVARRGKTARADLERVRSEIERASGRLAGAVLISG